MAFKDRAGGGGGLDGVAGFMIKQPGTPHTTQLPDWNTFTSIRIFPAPRQGGWHPMRNTVEFDDFGPAVETEPVVKKLGAVESFTYITRIPGLEGEDPTTKLTTAILNIAEQSPHDIPKEWFNWTQSGPGRGAKITKVSTHVFAQAAAFAIKGKECKNKLTGKAEPRFPILFMGSLSILMSFSSLGNALRDGVDMPAEFPATDTEEGRQAFDALCGAAFQLGDWCSPEHGHLLKIYQADKGDNEMPHYTIEPLEERPLSESMLNRVRSFWTPWNQLLRYHTAEQQIGYLKRAFPPEMLDFALGRSEYEGLLSDDVRGSWQRMQQKMAGAYTTGLPVAAQQQLNTQLPPQMPKPAQQVQSAPVTQPQPTPATQPQQQAAADDWGTGQPSDDSVGPTGPAVPGTPTEFQSAAQQSSVVQGNQPNVQPSNVPTTAPHTPGAAVSGHAVDPAQLAAALDMMNAAKKNKQDE